MDDIIILVKNKRQYRKAKKCLFTILRELKLQVSSHKTRMGVLKHGFHFLGIDFEVSRNPQRQVQAATINIHARTCRRALDKVKAMRTDAVHPANIQRYLSRWATWWHLVTELETHKLIYKWVCYTADVQPPTVWYGRGLLLGSPVHFNLTYQLSNSIQYVAS